MRIAPFFFVLGLSLACTHAPAHKDAESDLPVEGSADSFRSPTDHGALVLGQAAAARLDEGAQYHSWTFELTGAADVLLETDSPVPYLDTVLYLYQWNGETWGRYQARNDDHHGSLLSQLSLSLDQGQFRVLVKGYSDAEVGDFELLSTCDGVGCSAPVDGCFFGEELRDIRTGAGFRPIATRAVTSPSELLGIEEAQVLRAVALNYTHVTTLSEAFAAVDQRTINLEVYQDKAAGVYYRVVEFGAGDNSYGAVFVAEQTLVAARIVDGFFEQCAGRALSVDGVVFSASEAAAAVAYANEATEATMRADGLYARAIPSILAARPIADLPTLAALSYVGPSTLEAIKQATGAMCSGDLRLSSASTAIDVMAESAACQPVGGFCAIESVRRFTVDGCGYDLDALVNEALTATGLRLTEYRGTYTMGRPGLAMRTLFENGLLAAMDAEVAANGGALTDVRARTFEDEVPCHNCHEFPFGAVVEYPGAGVVYVVTGRFGWDS